MPHRTHGRVSRQINSAQERLRCEPGLPFSQWLPTEVIRAALTRAGTVCREGLFTPWVTFWVFLSQVLDPKQCCLQAVLRFLAYRVSQGLPACSSETGA